MSRVKYDVLARTGTYTNAGGEEKSRWMKCGVVFENEKGYLSLKLEGIPVGQEWSGFFSLFEPKRRDGADSGAKPDFSDDIKF